MAKKIDLSAFRNSRPQPQALPEDRFREALASHGLHPGEIAQTEDFVRFSTKGKAGEKNGYYTFSVIGTFAHGVFGDWSKDIHETWSSADGQSLSDAERVRYQQQAKILKAKREQEKQERYQDARKRAQSDLEQFKPASEHMYLERKKIQPQGDVRINSDGELIIPVMDEHSQPMSYQRIKPDGSKRFMQGGQIAGGMFCIPGNDSILCIVEGYATGATIHEATGYTVICAFNAGNLKPVAQTVRRMERTKRILICADNDINTDGNPGVTKGTEAAQAIGVDVVYPKFTAGDGTDFNDLADREGVAEVKRQVNKVVGNGPVDLHKSDLIDVVSLFTVAPPKKEWILENLVPKGTVGSLVAPGGTGKSNFVALACRAMCTGWEYGGMKPDKEYRVLSINVEDPFEDIWRRMYQQGQIYPLKEGELYSLQRNFMPYSGIGVVKPFLALENGNPMPTQWFVWLENAINTFKPDICILDTKSRLYGADENNNDHATQWLRLLESICVRTGCGFWVIHHTAKNARADQTAARGASAFVDNSRFVIHLQGMDEAQGKYFGIQERWKYFSMTNSKANYAPGFKPIWYEKQEQGVPVMVDIYALKDQNIQQGLLQIMEQCHERDEQFSIQDIKRSQNSDFLRAAAKEHFKLTKAQLVYHIEAMINDGTLATQKVTFNNKKPKKIVTINP